MEIIKGDDLEKKLKKNPEKYIGQTITIKDAEGFVRFKGKIKNIKDEGIEIEPVEEKTVWKDNN